MNLPIYPQTFYTFTTPSPIFFFAPSIVDIAATPPPTD